MKFDLIIGNPPYDRSLHLKILKKAMEYCDFDSGGEIVWLSPVPILVSPRNIYCEMTKKKFRSITQYRRLADVEILSGDECGGVFDAHFQLKLGIQTYSGEERSVDPETHIAADLPVRLELIRKIMSKCQEKSLANAKQAGSFRLPISWIHGHAGKEDFLNIFSLTYETQLKSKGTGAILFETEEDRRAFYDFWMSDLGRLVVSFWKVDTHVMDKYIPYAAFKNDEDFFEYFDLAEDEKKLLRDAAAKRKAK